MKRIWRISEISQLVDLLCLSSRSSSTLKTLTPFCFTVFRSPKHPPNPLELHGQTLSRARLNHSRLPQLSSLFIGKPPVRVRVPAAPRNELARKVAVLKDELLRNREDSNKVARILEGTGRFLFQSYDRGAVLVELLRQLRSWPLLALQVFNWRRSEADRGGIPLTADEYAKGISVYGRAKNVDMAIGLFNEAEKKGLKATSTYNALMGAYMWNGLPEKCKKLFEDFRKQPNCSPSVATYNILISVFGRLMTVDRMEAVFEELKVLNIPPNLSTYDNLIAGYICAWKWDKMEATFQMMKNGPVRPKMSTYLLMLRGYANSGNLVQMEETYELVKYHVNRKEIPLIESMICAYFRSSDKGRVEKIETLSRLIPKRDYMPWLSVLLIRVYAQEDKIELMEDFIKEAFERKLHIETVGTVKSIVASYFRCNAVDRLANFLERAQSGGWRICRSVYHCLMIMYGTQRRLEEMESVLHEMDNSNIRRVKKTFCILHSVYSLNGQKYKVDQVSGMMLKHGHGMPRPSDWILFDFAASETT